MPTPIERFLSDRSEAGEEYRQKAKEAGQQLKQTTASKVLRGAISGPLKAINETVETVDDVADYFRGNPYDNNDLIDLQSIGLEVEGDKEDWTYTVPQAVTQFLLPMGLVGGGLRKVITNPWARGAVAGFITDAVVQDPYEENLFNMLDEHPTLLGPVTEVIKATGVPGILKAKTPNEIGVAEARLIQATGGTLTGEIATGVVLGVRALRKAPKAVQERILKRLMNDENTRLVYAASDDIDNLGDEIIPLPKSISRNLSKADLKDTFDLVDGFVEDGFNEDKLRPLLKKIGDYIEGESTTYPLSVKDTEEVNNLIQSFKTSDPTVFEEYGRLQQSIKESLGGPTSDEIDEMLWRQNSELPPKKIAERLRENLKNVAQSDAKALDVGGGGAAVPPRKPPSGSSGADVPSINPDDDLIKKPSKPIGYNRNPRVFGPRQADIDFTDRALKAEAEVNLKYPTTMSDDYVIAIGEDIPFEDLKARIRHQASRMRGMDDKKALRISYQRALRVQKQLTTQLVDSTKAIEDALLSGKQDIADEQLEIMATAYEQYRELITPVKIIGSEAAGTLRASQLIDKPVTKRIPINEELKKTWTTSERIAKDQAGNKTTKELVEAATKDIDEQALIPTKEEIFEAIKKAKDTGDIEGIVNLTRKIQAMQGDPNKIGKLFESTNLWTKTRDGAVKLGRISNELFINSILSAPETHIVNVVGSLFNVASGPVDLFLGSPLTDKTLKGRAAYELMSMFTSLEDSLKMAGKAIYLDRNLLDERRMFGRDGNSRYAIRMDPDQKTFALRSLAKVVNWGGHGARSFSRLMLGGD